MGGEPEVWTLSNPPPLRLDTHTRTHSPFTLTPTPNLSAHPRPFALTHSSPSPFGPDRACRVRAPGDRFPSLVSDLGGTRRLSWDREWPFMRAILPIRADQARPSWPGR